MFLTRERAKAKLWIAAKLSIYALAAFERLKAGPMSGTG